MKSSRVTGVGCVIATRNRAKSLAEVLKVLQEGSLVPEVVVVVDSSDDRDANAAKCLSQRVFRTVFLRSDRRSLTHQRMMGVAYLLGESNVDSVLFLDDDTFPSKTFVEELQTVLRQNSAAVGAGGTTLPKEPLPTEGLKGLILRRAGLTGEAGSVSSSGVGIPEWCYGPPREVEWLLGCSMWRISVFATIIPRTDWDGSCLGEDIEFSLRAGKLGSLILVPNATLNHAPNEGEHIGARQAAHRHEQFVRHRIEYRSLVPGFSRSAFFASLGISVLSQPSMSGKLGAARGVWRARRSLGSLWM